MNTENHIARTEVNPECRGDILPSRVGRHYLKFEMHIFHLSDCLLEEYTGGLWDFYDLSNGGFYMAINREGGFTYENTDNYFKEHMSSDAACIAVNLMVFSRLSFTHPDPFAELFHQLRDYALQHEEAALIHRAID